MPRTVCKVCGATKDKCVCAKRKFKPMAMPKPMTKTEVLRDKVAVLIFRQEKRHLPECWLHVSQEYYPKADQMLKLLRESGLKFIEIRLPCSNLGQTCEHQIEELEI